MLGNMINKFRDKTIMDIKRHLLGLLCIFTLGSCSIPDKDSPMMYFYIRFAHGSERGVYYNSEKESLEIPNYISLHHEIISQNPEINPISTRNYYVNYSNPFEFYINIELLDREITEIQFLNCIMRMKDCEINLFDTLNTNINLSEFKEWYDAKQFSAGTYKDNFLSERKIFVKNTSEYYFSGYSLGFKELILDYSLNDEITIKYDIIITNKNNDTIKKTIEMLYKRSILETIVEEDSIQKKEISLEEWKKYL